METKDLILKLMAEGGTLNVYRTYMGFNKDNSSDYSYFYSTNEMGLEDSDKGFSKNAIDLSETNLSKLLTTINKKFQIKTLYPEYINPSYNVEIIDFLRKLIKLNDIKLNDFRSINSWMEKLNINENTLSDEYIFDKNEFLKKLNSFTKNNYTIREQWGWNRIVMTHASFQNEKDYKKYLLKENVKNSDGYFNDINQSGLYAFYNGDECLYIGKAKKIINRLVDHYKSSTNYIKPNRPTDGQRQREIFSNYSDEELTIYYINLDDTFKSIVGEHLRTTIEGMLQLEYYPEFEKKHNYTNSPLLAFYNSEFQ